MAPEPIILSDPTTNLGSMKIPVPNFTLAPILTSELIITPGTKSTKVPHTAMVFDVHIRAEKIAIPDTRAGTNVAVRKNDIPHA